MIHLELNEEEHKKLMEAVYLADWLDCAQKGENDPKARRYSGIEQKVYSKAAEAGCQDLVESDEKSGELFPTNKMDDACHDVLDEYMGEAFWTDLAERMACRDIERMKGRGSLERMTGAERSDLIGAGEEKYLKEFEVHGLDRLEIKN